MSGDGNVLSKFIISHSKELLGVAPILKSPKSVISSVNLNEPSLILVASNVQMILPSLMTTIKGW